MDIWEYGLYSAGAQCISPAHMQLREQWRALWEQHVAWTRMTIIAAVHNLPGLPQTAARLLRNPADMGMLIGKYYGEATGAQLTELMRGHLLIAIDLVNASKAGDTAAAAKIEQAWYANADAIAHFLASINPYLPEAAMREMLHQHLALVKAEAVAELTGDGARSVAVYDQNEMQALQMADTISTAMIRQFRL